jgi:hypothetical protein
VSEEAAHPTAVKKQREKNVNEVDSQHLFQGHTPDDQRPTPDSTSQRLHHLPIEQWAEDSAFNMGAF